MLASRTFGATKRRPGQTTEAIIETYSRLGDIDRVVAKLHCSPKAVRTALRRKGMAQPTKNPPMSNVGPTPRTFRCPCCNQVRSSGTCPDTGEVFCQAFA